MPFSLPVSIEAALAENNICTLTTVRPDGSLHVVPVRFTWDGDAGLVRVITVGSRRKARNVAASPASRAAVCQVAGFRWITLEGPATVSGDSPRVAEGIRRYVERYHSPPPQARGLVVIEIAVDRVMSLNS